MNNVKEPEIFKCKKCGGCCKGFGGTYVSPEDIEAISRYIGAELDGFVEKYCQMSGGKPVLAQKKNGYCIFWDDLCTIHPVKPYMCRAWPFIGSILHDVSNWYIMASVCPGMRSDVPASIVTNMARKKIFGADL